ncbi:MAG: homoserine dehydrogenase [Tissierella sp.]|nr:homoserine dehydrogenase [Tissierella sp.]
MRIAIIGYGGVGRAFVRLIIDKKDELYKEGINPIVKYVLGSKGGVYDKEGIDIEKFIDFPSNKSICEYPEIGSKSITFDTVLKNKDVDIVIEMTPTNLETGEPGLNYIRRSLENGIHVITSNKAPILLAYKKLYQIALENKVQLGIGCTTGGALPSINGGIIDLAGANINSIEGILNGTTNYILEEMDRSKIEYPEALKKAQKLGIAETNPTLDVEGWDTATKLLILTNVLMNENKTIEDIDVKGITSIKLSDIEELSKKDKKYKLIGRTTILAGKIKMTVGPEIVGSDNLLYNVNGKDKVVKYTSDTLGDLTIIGGASGVIPAAASILRDLINIHRGYKYIRGIRDE